MDANGGVDEVRPQRAWWDLKAKAAPLDGVVVADLALFLDDRISRDARCCRRRRRPIARARPRRPRCGRRCRSGRASDWPPRGWRCQRAPILGQAILQRAEGSLRAAARLRRIGRDVLDAELRQGAPDLGAQSWTRLAGLGRVEVMAAPIGVERAEQPVPLDHLADRAKARLGALLIDQKGRVDRARRVVERHHQIVRPSIARQPGKGEAS